MTPEKNVEPVLIMENLDNEEIEQIINKRNDKCFNNRGYSLFF